MASSSPLLASNNIPLFSPLLWEFGRRQETTTMETTTATTIDDDSDDEGDTDGDGDDGDGNNGNDYYFSHTILHYYNMVQYCNIVW